MTWHDTLLGIVGLVLGSGGVKMTQVVLEGRANARKIQAETRAIEGKGPAELESIALQGAGSAVTMLELTNKALLEENRRLREHNDRLEQIIESLEGELGTATAALQAARDQYEALQREIAEFRRERLSYRNAEDAE